MSEMSENMAHGNGSAVMRKPAARQVAQSTRDDYAISEIQLRLILQRLDTRQSDRAIARAVGVPEGAVVAVRRADRRRHMALLRVADNAVRHCIQSMQDASKEINTGAFEELIRRAS